MRLFLRLEHGIPSHDTFSPVFRLLKPQAFEKVFRRFMSAFAKANALKLTGVWPSMARRCVAPTSEAAKPRRCIWSTSLQWKPAWLWLSRKRLAATRRWAPWRCWTFSVWKAASLLIRFEIGLVIHWPAVLDMLSGAMNKPMNIRSWNTDLRLGGVLGC